MNKKGFVGWQSLFVCGGVEMRIFQMLILLSKILFKLQSGLSQRHGRAKLFNL
jgi:hypothetical protein